ncbi:MAG: hypothetical protein ABW006_14190 [Hyphomicrobium sp.]
MVHRIIHQDQNAKIARRDRRPESIALNGKCRKAARNAIRFVSGGYRDYGATLSDTHYSWLNDYRAIDRALLHPSSFYYSE